MRNMAKTRIAQSGIVEIAEVFVGRERQSWPAVVFVVRRPASTRGSGTSSARSSLIGITPPPTKRNFDVYEDTIHRRSAVCRPAFCTRLGSARQLEGRGRRSGDDCCRAGTPSVLAASWPLALSRLSCLSFVWLLPRVLWLSTWLQLVLRRTSPSALGPSSPSLVSETDH
jgi:hypothetical protein